MYASSCKSITAQEEMNPQDHENIMRDQASDAYSDYKTNEKDIIHWLIRWVQANCTAEEWEDLSQPYNGDPDKGPDLLRLAEAFAAKSDRKNPGPLLGGESRCF